MVALDSADFSRFEYLTDHLKNEGTEGIDWICIRNAYWALLPEDKLGVDDYIVSLGYKPSASSFGQHESSDRKNYRLFFSTA